MLFRGGDGGVPLHVMHYTSIWRLMLIALINKIFNSRTRKKGLEL